MKVLVLSTALAATTSGVGAFAPPSRNVMLQKCEIAASRSMSPNTAIAALPTSIPNPYKNLPWVTDREQKRQERSIEIDNASLFRELGLPEDAEYEQVKEKTDSLIEDAAGDIKKKIRVEVARDKIYSLRLKERVEGVSKPKGDVLKMSKFEDGTLIDLSDSVDHLLKPKKGEQKPLVERIPLVSYFASIYTPPDEAWKKRQLIIWGASTLLCLLVPTLTEGALRINWLPAGGMMGYRGMKIEGGGGGGFNPYRGRRNKKHQVVAIGIAVGIWVMSRSVAEFVLARVPAMAASRSAEWFKLAIVQTCLGFATMNLQTYKEGEDSPDLMI